MKRERESLDQPWWEVSGDGVEGISIHRKNHLIAKALASWRFYDFSEGENATRMQEDNSSFIKGEKAIKKHQLIFCCLFLSMPIPVN